jgi:hypothetical protein
VPAPYRLRGVSALALAGVAVAGLIWYDLRAAAPPEPPPPGARYLGSEACRDCHAALFEQYRHTGHYRALQAVTPGSLADTFGATTSRFDFGAAGQFYLLRPGARYVQEAYVRDTVRVARIAADLALGSGKYAQCYLWWNEDALFLLPLSHYTEQGAWGFGPGIHRSPDSMVGWWPASPRCLECHATYFESIPERSHTGPSGHAPLGRAAYRRDNAVPGISCEKCHGPGSAHVAHHRAHPRKPPRFTVNPADLPVPRQVDVCALCHAPSEDVLQPSFSFRPGDDLAGFVRSADIDPGRITPHATQAPYIRHSRCFQHSPRMTCTTCHDPHRHERGDLAAFSARCLACHRTDHTCPEAMHRGVEAQRNCIDCHMPLLPATDLSIVGPGGARFGLRMRTHLIGNYSNGPTPRLTAPPP